MYVVDNKELHTLKRKRKVYVQIGLEEDVAKKFKTIAKDNGITYSDLLGWLIEKAKESKDSDDDDK